MKILLFAQQTQCFSIEFSQQTQDTIHSTKKETNKCNRSKKYYLIKSLFV